MTNSTQNSFEPTHHDKGCSEPECSNTHYARGFCHSHYTKKRKTGELKLIERPTECSVAGCNSKPRTRGMCHRHYERERRGQVNFIVMN